MYEEKKFKLDINWKSLLIKLGILLLIVFIICFIIFRPKKTHEFVSLEANINTVKEAAIEYYKSNMNFKKIGDYKKVTLEELINSEFIGTQEDSKGNSCDAEKSYAYLTKVRDDEFVLKINMNCGKNEESQTYNLTSEDLTIIADTEDNNEVIENEENVLVDSDEITEEPNIKEDDEEIVDSSTNKNNDNPKKEDVIIAQKPDNKVLRYKHIKYGEWIEGTKYADNIQNSTKEVTFYEYCFKDYCVVDRIENVEKYMGYTATYKRTETIPVYRYIFVVWSNSTCVKGFINTGITEYR